MDRKKKQCKGVCGKLQYLFSGGYCKQCHMIEFPEKYRISNKGYKAHRGSTRDFSSKAGKKSPKGRKSLEKPPKTDRRKIKDLLDTIYSKYIRLRDSDSKGMCACITCGRKGFWEKDIIQCGHYVKRRKDSVRWDEDNAHAQCLFCNYDFRTEDMDKVYKEKMIEKLGTKGEEELILRSNQEAHYSIEELELMLENYEEKFQSLLGKKTFPPNL